MRGRRFYITTAIDYANGDPHQGHAYEKIGADAIARFHRLLGEEVRFCMGMDEHGQKVAQSAAALGIAPQQLVDDLAARFEGVWRRLGVSNDRWVRTTQPHHRRGVKALIERIFARNPDDFYEQAYEGWYCVGCELFKREGEIEDGRCVLHPTRTLEWAEERNWFFRLSRYEDFLRRRLTAHPEMLQPEARRNEMLALLDSGLEDISVTRARLAWAIPFPRPSSDGETQGTWVWFDALPNYLTDTGYPDAGWEEWWPAQLHVVGKDIVRLHSIVWPAMLESAGLPLPERVWGHGFVLLGGERFSKSAGVGLDLGEAIDRFGPDALRYFLLREVPWDADGSFGWERFTERYTAELANGLGNLASRALSMVAKYREGRVPGSPQAADELIGGVLAKYRAAMEASLLHEGAAAAFELVWHANAYVSEQAPWKLAKDPAAALELDGVLHAMVRYLAVATVLFFPFMPGKMAELWERLGCGRSMPLLDDLAALDVSGWQVSAGDPLFPRPEPAPA
ncbi:MAG TPA: methionine--tRNA ligase [Longimicrobiaceae bacterium]|nr:methionine--tRNA ligase [Longimicrobiaceae bacterium]